MDHRIHQLPQQVALNPVKKSVGPSSTVPFKDFLTLEQKELKISKHANQRLNERNIQINEKQWQLIGEKVSEAKKKGITDSLVVMDQAALLVSAKNHTVVTAMNREEATNRIFSNINGTIIINR
ncbi:TIGR02530 family flagellar biosynthesis protein [Virgibacillus halodenitrificans]|uniref:TIGR02530 family flagellar biosynthesis protein n=1 Tax=Virgibacillus halodenitrificans TaxID=1482 RepID=UPI00031C7E23|nr:TIGR02530 family flagellar biosynthesis protein [Virgibacillus halodenitrificans]CDQ35841.1 flagellar operon protein [Virgibacillus halodenitrificans]